MTNGHIRDYTPGQMKSIVTLGKTANKGVSMLQKTRPCLVALVLFMAYCGNSDPSASSDFWLPEGVGGTASGSFADKKEADQECLELWGNDTSSLVYTGPTLKIPLNAPYQWLVNTEAGGKSNGWYDTFHAGKHSFSIDFDDNVWGNDHTDFSALSISIPVIAAADGRVITVVNEGCPTLVERDAKCKKWSEDTGKTQQDCPYKKTACGVTLDHGNGYTSTYLHFKQGTVEVKTGDRVRQGDFLGILGNTGDSTGDHLHFELRHRGDGCFNNPNLRGVTLEQNSWFDFKLHELYRSTNSFSISSSTGVNPFVCAKKSGINGCIGQSNPVAGTPSYVMTIVRQATRDFCTIIKWYRGKNLVETSAEYCTDDVENSTGVNKQLWTEFTPWNAGSWTAEVYIKLKQHPLYLRYPAASMNFSVLESGTVSLPPPPLPPPPPANTWTSSYTYAGENYLCSLPWLPIGNPPGEYSCPRNLPSYYVGSPLYPKLKLYYLAPLTRYSFLYELYRGTELVSTWETPSVYAGYGGTSPLFVLPTFTPDSPGLWTLRVKIRIKNTYESFTNTLQDIRVVAY